MSTDRFGLHGRVAIVTGGTRGIGFGIAQALLQAGARVVISGRDVVQAEAAVAQLWAEGGDAAFLAADIAEQGECKALVEATAQKFGRLDLLVNNAGTNISNRPEDISLLDFQTIIATNLTSAFLCAQAAFPIMQRQGGGKIINIGSTASIFGSATGAAYAASKGGVVQLTKSLAVAWGRENIQVNAILPGYIESDMLRRTDAERPGFLAATNARTPMGRRGLPADVGGLAVFLASGASDFITGTAIPVDGGYSVQI